MKIKLIIIGLATAIRVQADTNFFETLTCGTDTYTNATISQVTPAYVTVTYAGGMAQVPLCDLPENLQQQYHYNSNAAAQFRLEQKAKSQQLRAATTARQAAFETAIATQIAQSQNIQITAILDESSNGGLPLCSVGFSGGGGGTNRPVPGRILLENIAPEARDFLHRYNQLRNDIITFGETVHNDAIAAQRADALAPVGAGGDAAYVNSVMAQRDRANQMVLNVKEEADRLEQMQDELKQMASVAIEKTTIRAYPSRTYGTYEIWECVGMAPRNPISEP